MATPKRRKTDTENNDRMYYKSLKFLTILTIIAIVVLVSLLAFWQFYPYNPITTYPKPYKIVYPPGRVVSQGGYITYEFKYTKNMDLVPTVTRQFVDGLIFNIAGQQDPSVGPIGSGVARTQIEIPETLPPGKYHIQIGATYQVNPIRAIHNDSITEDFEVISNEEPVLGVPGPRGPQGIPGKDASETLESE